MSEGTPRPIKSLERFRHLRGDDRAVVEIGLDNDRQTLLSIIKNPGSHSRHELLHSVFANYSGAAYGNYQWPRITGGWTAPEEPTLYGTMRSAYPTLTQLSLDPGFITHLPDILRMIEAGEVRVEDYLKAREEFKEKLGSRTMFRGTMLTDEELTLIKEFGILSLLAKHVAAFTNPQEEFEAKALSTNIHYSIESHFHGENYFTPFLSVSAYNDIATAVGRCFAARGEGRKFYLFTLQVPMIDMVSYTDHGVRMPQRLRQSFDYNPDYSVNIAIDGNESEYKWDENVESYIFWKIDPGDIVEVSQPGVRDSSWNRRTTVWT